jgi:hypothetical protein
LEAALPQILVPQIDYNLSVFSKLVEREIPIDNSMPNGYVWLNKVSKDKLNIDCSWDWNWRKDYCGAANEIISGRRIVNGEPLQFLIQYNCLEVGKQYYIEQSCRHCLVEFKIIKRLKTLIEYEIGPTYMGNYDWPIGGKSEQKSSGKREVFKQKYKDFLLQWQTWQCYDLTMLWGI